MLDHAFAPPPPFRNSGSAPKTDGWFGFELTKNILVKAPNGSMSILFVSFQRKEILSVSYSFQPKHTQLGYKMKINFENFFFVEKNRLSSTIKNNSLFTNYRM